jgi:hypothetical protein
LADPKRTDLNFMRHNVSLFFTRDDQTGIPTRPQANQNQWRTLWGTLRILISRERSWRSVSASRPNAQAFVATPLPQTH